MTLEFETRDTGQGTRPIHDAFRVPRLASRVPLLALTMCLFAGCGNIEPWVKPYERAALAESIMMPSRHPVADDFLLHVYEVREAGRGASGSAGGGCGCN